MTSTRYKTHILIGLFTLSSLIGWCQVKNYTQDFNIFKTIIESSHPALHRYITEVEWNVLLEQSAKEVITIKSDLEFYQLIAPILHRIGDTHIELKLSKELEEDTGRFILPVEVIQGEIYCSKREYDIPKGAKIISINAIPAGEILFRLSKFAFADALNYKKIDQAVSQRFERFMYYEFGPMASFRIEYIPYGEQKIISSTIEGSDADYINEKYWENQNNTEYTLDEFGSYPANLSPQLKIIEDPEIALLTIPTFSVPQWFFLKMILKHFKTIENHGIENLIIDVRNNPGGLVMNAVVLHSFISTESFELWDSCYASTAPRLPFPEYATDYPTMSGSRAGMARHCDRLLGDFEILKTIHELFGNPKTRSLRFTSHPYVLFNSRSYSAASEFANLASRDDYITTVGTESGASRYAQTAGTFADYTLPNSKIAIHFGLIALTSNKPSDAQIWNGVIPDHPIEPTQESLYHDSDDQLEKAISLIYENKGQND